MSVASEGIKMRCTRETRVDETGEEVEDPCGHEWTYTGNKEYGPVTCPRCGTSVMLSKGRVDEDE